jgi:hypothetical protein
MREELARIENENENEADELLVPVSWQNAVTTTPCSCQCSDLLVPAEWELAAP